MTPDRFGLVVGAVLGLTYVAVNAGVLPFPLGALLRILGGVAFVCILIALRRDGSTQAGNRPTRRGFGQGYWLVVAAGVAAGALGIVLLNGPLDLPQGALPWVSFVVGVHFFGLATVWDESSLRWLGGGIGVLGALGLGLASAGASDASVASIAGVCPGALLLTGSLWGAAEQGR
jgi:hypothetical protein